MKTYSAVVIFAILVAVCCTAKKIPDDVQVCKRDEPNCLQTRIKELLPKLAKGIPEMGIPPIDPLKIPSLYVDSGSGGSFAFDINGTNVNFVGPKDMVIEKAAIDHDKVTLELTFRFPDLDVNMHYRSKGKMLIIAIDGEGELELDFKDAILHGVWTGTKETKKGKEYYKFQKKEFKIKVLKGSASFGNLFKDNPELTESTNKVFNDNFEIAFQEFNPSIDNALEQITTGIINSVFQRFPVDELFPK